jgi:hypothetical protein
MASVDHAAHLDWPFLDAVHRDLARALEPWAASRLGGAHGHDVDAECRSLVGQLGAAGWLRHAVAGTRWGAAAEAIDTRAICVLRETLARHSGLADFAFATQATSATACCDLKRRARGSSTRTIA